MATPLETVQDDLKAAMKAGDKERTSALRLLLSAVKNERIRIGGELDEEGFFKLVRKSIKQCEESAAQYREGDRDEMAAKEEREAKLLGDYLPPEVGEDEIRDAVRAFVEERDLSGPGDIGPVMQEMMSRFAGRADGGTINRIAREVLSGSS